ncbi:sporulation histidine kinase inhibitor Sda [Neobacillus sp. NPDC093182]
MQILSIEHLLEVLYRSIDLNLQQEFIDLIVSEIYN